MARPLDRITVNPTIRNGDIAQALNYAARSLDDQILRRESP